jgi:(R,R)-butanediol dehydrogenase/meso-butanediol dehydrogenase/diacetyl reductase
LTIVSAELRAARAEMRAAVFQGPGRLGIETRRPPRVTAADDVLIRVEACGICGSDLQILAMPPGHPARPGVVLGHEICGRVVDAGPDVELRAGDLVVVDPDIKCGHCVACENGRPSLCRNLKAMGVDEDGGFAEFCKAPARNVFRVEESVPPVVASLAEPMAAVLHGVRSLEAKLGESALVIGAGPIGCLFVKVFVASGVRPVWVVEPVTARRELAVGLGASGAVAAAGEYLELTKAEGAPRPTLVVDAVGRCLEDAVALAADGGRILLFGINSTAAARVNQYELTMRELKIVGSVAASYTMEPAVRSIESDVAAVRALPIVEVRLDEIGDAIDSLRGGEIVKAVVREPA